ncbi:MAG: RNA-guided pseudouridylation complex pseudouridine synthase subunit Cbf5 [Nanoarchaeota archaeon]|nr:RNA-guided pseudouridylation complex pseudouridine synthase subunit Cbf5 [Nanoarchaeota archaeon]MBU4456341.1 RNA-guided pseudouridylation complex pseudouridine synthase subunit Cbf5 [Nanoarchaeota archaeon]MCG2719592.1 RNA-guided pseudouridylation complex pseudouridine synthase subunit Cbf5 [Nanoarchaeota archaeon]
MQLPFEKIEREILVKRDAFPNPAFGLMPEERSMEEMVNYGLINVNKQSGPTSHQIVDYVKGILHLDKAGHSGTLDPKVTGVLLVATGRATRIVQFLLTAGKEYVCLMHLHTPVSVEDIKKVAEKFVGEIEQMPPVRSAVKRQLRKRNIYYFEILEINEQDILFKIGCQAGTYVRKFVHDFGLELGTKAHMAELVRSKVASHTYENWISLHDLKDAYTLWKEGDEEELKKLIMPMEKAIDHIPKIWITDTSIDTLCHGASLSVPGIAKLHTGIVKGEFVGVMSLKNELVCMGEAMMSSEEIMENEKGLAVKNWKVFMQPDTYPKFLKKSL